MNDNDFYRVDRALRLAVRVVSGIAIIDAIVLLGLLLAWGPSL